MLLTQRDNLDIENKDIVLITQWLKPFFYQIATSPIFYLILIFLIFIVLVLRIYKQNKLKEVISKFFTLNNFYKICFCFCFAVVVRLFLKQYDIMFFESDLLFTISSGVTITSNFISECFDLINVKSPFDLGKDLNNSFNIRGYYFNKNKIPLGAPTDAKLEDKNNQVPSLSLNMNNNLTPQGNNAQGNNAQGNRALISSNNPGSNTALNPFSSNLAQINS